MKRVLLLMALGGNLTFTGCAGTDSPENVAEAFYVAANEGRCADARRYFTDGALQEMVSRSGDPTAFEAFCRNMGRRSQLVQVTVKHATSSDDEASVVLERRYEDGAVSEVADCLVKDTDGHWQLSLRRCGYQSEKDSGR